MMNPVRLLALAFGLFFGFSYVYAVEDYPQSRPQNPDDYSPGEPFGSPPSTPYSIADVGAHAKAPYMLMYRKSKDQPPETDPSDVGDLL